MRNVPGSWPASAAVASVAAMLTVGIDEAPMVPGEPISLIFPAATNAPLRPATLRVVMPPLFTPAALSKVGKGPAGEVPKSTWACTAPPPSKRFTASPPVLSPTPEPPYEPICRLAGGLAPNQMVLKFAASPAAVCPLPSSMKITDSPGAMLAMPLSGTAEPNELELSSIFQPVMFWAAVPMLVTSNQSAARLLLPLDHGATSEMISCGVPPVEAVIVSV